MAYSHSTKWSWRKSWLFGLSYALFRNFVEITLGHGCSPVNLQHIFRTPFPKNTSGRKKPTDQNLELFTANSIWCYLSANDSLVHRDSIKKIFQKVVQNFTGMAKFLFNKVSRMQKQKYTLSYVLNHVIYEIYRDIFFYKIPPWSYGEQRKL